MINIMMNVTEESKTVSCDSCIHNEVCALSETFCSINDDLKNIPWIKVKKLMCKHYRED